MSTASEGEAGMPNRPVSIRIPENVRTEIAETARRARRDFSSVANEMLEEAVRTRRIPGIVFIDGGGERQVVVAGTGLEVWEVIETYRDVSEDFDRLKACYDHLNDFQLRAAIAYATAYPDEIDARIAENESWTPERVWETNPFTRPPWR
jgi:uncharacterized protein (DUF433 family)